MKTTMYAIFVAAAALAFPLHASADQPSDSRTDTDADGCVYLSRDRTDIMACPADDGGFDVAWCVADNCGETERPVGCDAMQGDDTASCILLMTDCACGGCISGLGPCDGTGEDANEGQEREDALALDWAYRPSACTVDSTACTINCGAAGGCSCGPHAGAGHWDCTCKLGGYSETTVDWDGCPWSPPAADNEVILSLAPGISLSCDTDSMQGSPACVALFANEPVGGDPLDGQVCLGDLCVGCNTGEDVGSKEPYLECFACAGERCISATCTTNDGPHCCYGC